MIHTYAGHYAPALPRETGSELYTKGMFLFTLIKRYSLSVALIALIGVVLSPAVLPPLKGRPPEVPIVITLTNPFVYSFNTNGTLYEAGSSSDSTSPYWWLNSGAKLILKDKVGKTVQGPLPLLDPWRLKYALANPTDTDSGAHPQNIFRLVAKDVVGNSRVEALFKIEKDNFSASPNRNASNGLLLMSRYVDGDTLYYAGVRVDGTAVIKKKYRGTYYTMAQAAVFPGSYTVSGNINLIPHNEWIGLRTENIANGDGSVTVRLFLQRTGGSWQKILEAKDDGKKYGNTPAIQSLARTGIRTDFMDVTFDSFKVEAL